MDQVFRKMIDTHGMEVFDSGVSLDHMAAIVWIGKTKIRRKEIRILNLKPEDGRAVYMGPFDFFPLKEETEVFVNELRKIND